MKATIVVPTIREKNIVRFLDGWKDQFAGSKVIVIEDNPEKTFHITGNNVEHFSWREIDSELGDDAWIIPRRSDCVRSFGYYKAYKDNPDFILTLDDDCFPGDPELIIKHSQNLSTLADAEVWTSTGDGIVPRGMPYENITRRMQCYVSHGLWSSVPDLDALTQLVNRRTKVKFEGRDQVIPTGNYFPMCGMNLAFRRDVVPAMYFLLMGKDWPYDRFGDIWAGIFVKKICDHLGYAVRSGEPYVKHLRASNVWRNLEKEFPGYQVNETLWQEVDGIRLSGQDFKSCYKELSQKLVINGDYWDKLRRAMAVWADLF